MYLGIQARKEAMYEVVMIGSRNGFPCKNWQLYIWAKLASWGIRGDEPLAYSTLWPLWTNIYLGHRSYVRPHILTWRFIRFPYQPYRRSFYAVCFCSGASSIQRCTVRIPFLGEISRNGVILAKSHLRYSDTWSGVYENDQLKKRYSRYRKYLSLALARHQEFLWY